MRLHRPASRTAARLHCRSGAQRPRGPVVTTASLVSPYDSEGLLREPPLPRLRRVGLDHHRDFTVRRYCAQSYFPTRELVNVREEAGGYRRRDDDVGAMSEAAVAVGLMERLPPARQLRLEREHLATACGDDIGSPAAVEELSSDAFSAPLRGSAPTAQKLHEILDEIALRVVPPHSMCHTMISTARRTRRQV